MKSIKQFLIFLSIAGMAGVAAAQTTNIILQTDFDGDDGQGNFANNYGYTAAGTSLEDPNTSVGVSENITAGAGVTNSSANLASPDYTQLASDPNWTDVPSGGYAYAIVGNGTQFGAPMAAITPTPVLGSFILSADLQVSGLLPSLTNADVIINKVQFYSGGNVIFDFTGDAGLVGSNFVHIAIPLSSLNYGAAPSDPAPANPVSDFTNAAVVGSIDSFTIEFAVNSLPVGAIGGGNPPPTPPFGFTSTGTLVVDNVELIQTGNTVPTPTQEKLIWQADFDSTFPNDGSFGFSYRDGSPSASGTVSTNLTGGVGGSASLEYTVDLSSWSSSPPTSFSGFGVGAIEDPLPFVLASTNKASYRVYLSAKVGGTSAGVTNVPGVIDLLFRVPPGALTPSNSMEAVVFDLNPTMTFSTNWQSYVFDNMPIGVNNGGSQTLFNQHVSQVNELALQVVPQGSPNVATRFDYDANNTVDVDNIRVVQLVTGLPPVSITNTAGQIKIYWTDPSTGGSSQLQSSTNVAGLYLNVPGEGSGANSPFTVPAGSKQQFFRAIWVP